jgi:hypothetical protein
MKKIIKPAEKEESVYYSDFSGKCFGELHAPIELKLEFGYGSIYDGSCLKFDLDDKDVEDILFLLKSKLNNDAKKVLKDMYTRLDNDYDGNVQVRDWSSCDYICNQTDLLKKLI